MAEQAAGDGPRRANGPSAHELGLFMGHVDESLIDIRKSLTDGWRSIHGRCDKIDDTSVAVARKLDDHAVSDQRQFDGIRRKLYMALGMVALFVFVANILAVYLGSKQEQKQPAAASANP